MTPSPDLLPRPGGPDQPHWDGARRGELVVQCCVNCGTPRFPAAVICARCGSDAHEWKAVARRGRVVSWCRFHRAYFAGYKEQVPYLVLLVELDSGIRMYVNPTGADDRELSIDETVEIVFEAVTPDVSLLRARRAD